MESVKKIATKKVTLSEQRQRNFYKKRSALSARLARGATLSMKVTNSGHICKKDISSFAATFFPDKRPLPYVRLNHLHKLLACQHVMHTQQSNMQPVPFVFRLSRELQSLDASTLNKKIQRKLKEVLKREPLFWTTREHDERYSNFEITHINGEILIFPGELEIIRESLRKMYGWRSKGVRSSLRFPLTSRNKQIQLYGEFYAIYNWPGYATKQDYQRDMKNRKLKMLRQRPVDSDGKIYYISKALNKTAAALYSGRIQQKTGGLKKSLTTAAIIAATTIPTYAEESESKLRYNPHSYGAPQLYYSPEARQEREEQEILRESNRIAKEHLEVEQEQLREERRHYDESPLR